MKEFVRVRKRLKNEDVRHNYQVTLVVGVQHFDVGPCFEERNDAQWFADQLVTALESLKLLTAESEKDHDFIFTKAAARNQHARTAFRNPPPHELMQRWVNCHIIGEKIVLGDLE